MQQHVYRIGFENHKKKQSTVKREIKRGQCSAIKTAKCYPSRNK